MADNHLAFLSLILGLISSLIARFQTNLALQIDYYRRRQNITRSLSVPLSRFGRLKRLRGFPPRPRRFWIRPWRTSGWWDNFVAQKVVEEECRKNFRMSRASRMCSQEIYRFQTDSSYTCRQANTIRMQYRVDANFFENGNKKLRFQMKTDTCGRGFKFVYECDFLVRPNSWQNQFAKSLSGQISWPSSCLLRELLKIS